MALGKEMETLEELKSHSHRQPPLAPPLGPGPKEALAVPFKGLRGARVSVRAEQSEERLSGGAGSYKAPEDTPRSHQYFRKSVLLICGNLGEGGDEG